MNNWKTNLGGAISVTGTALIGVGILPQLGGVHTAVLTYTALAGFIMSAIGKGLTALFAADASKLAELSAKVESIKAP